MDIASVSALIATIAAAVATVWTVYEGRAPLRRLERISLIVKELPNGNDARRELEIVQTSLARRINHSYRAPRRLFELALAWLLRLCGGILVGSSYVWATATAGTYIPSPDPGTSGASWGLWALYGGFGLVFLAVAALVLWSRQNSRLKWLTSHGPSATKRPEI